MERHNSIANPMVARAAERETGSAAERTAEKASSLRDEVQARTRQMADEQKRKSADRMGSIARAVRSAAGDLEREMPQAAGFIQDAAQRLEETSADLKHLSLDEIMDRVGDFARRQPAAFFGGAVFAGFILSRFLKSSSSRTGEGPGASITPH